MGDIQNEENKKFEKKNGVLLNISLQNKDKPGPNLEVNSTM